MVKRPKADRSRFRYFSEHKTRLSDNDIYHHMSNLIYLAYFDSVVNTWLVTTGGLTIPKGDILGFIVENGCVYHSSLAWPETIDIGICTTRVGRTSITFRGGLFSKDSEFAAAEPFFTHVYVDAETQRPVELPSQLREVAEAILLDN